ncbi:lysylphosphatidylglycerol synthase transmembrane domain-containing protein [Domibacillus mangrovi]|uniref:Phosphatidylglycerol lysyltransferase n=1 Tax=Domibacillus mangrovi TaxID=1714354 RepID=A0A1Q5P021_9BACI|nr:lysylphosphatidylglycerol synthase transmembrane domain-containing protein [Domibacillus mangrovi]OKL35605.1 hypothetical protein BLL40_14510 [Domibacillus mangrovi]
MKRFFKKVLSILTLVGFAFLTIHSFDENHLGNSIQKIFQQPVLLAAILIVYFLSFCLKAAAWKLYLNGKARYSTCLIGILYSLLINHLLPVKVGDVVRAKIASTREPMLKDDEAFHSVVVLRLLDMFCLVGIAMIGLSALKVQFRFPLWLVIVSSFISLLVLAAIHHYAPVFWNKHIQMFKKAFSGKTGLFIIACTFLSWLFEASILYGTVMMVQGDLSFLASVFANSVTIAGQVLQITPGGIGNYESFLVFALTLFGFPVREGYTIAVVTHALKFAISYITGAVVLLLYPVSFRTLKEWIKIRRVREK